MKISCNRLFAIACLALAAVSNSPAASPPLDIAGPAGSGAFGRSVYVLPNGNIVVVDPDYTAAGAARAGAVHLYAPNGNRISTLSGSAADDKVGHGGILILRDGNFVVLSSLWKGRRGAATWVNANAGLQAVVSESNSLVGTHADDYVGLSGTALLAGAYLVSSPNWYSDAGLQNVGALTFAQSGGIKGAVSAVNSLVGSHERDYVGDGVAPLASGSYVAYSSLAANGTALQAGAVVWCNAAAQGCRGELASVPGVLRGDKTDDQVGSGGVADLGNGNYVVVSQAWSAEDTTTLNVGAVTFRTPASAAAIVSSSNSLVGSLAGDQVGSAGVTVLASGDYVVASPLWANGAGQAEAGAATWGSGLSGVIGSVGPANSLVGSRYKDKVAERVVALATGHYVVCSPSWQRLDGVGLVAVGAATWANGNGSTTGLVSADSSLHGRYAGDRVGENMLALKNGHYLVGSPFWDFDPSTPDAGAVTWGNGSGGTAGPVNASNSLVSRQSGDALGANLHGLDSGNAVAVLPQWGPSGELTLRESGAIAMLSGSTPMSTVLSTANIIFGRLGGVQAGSGGVVPMGGDGFFIASPRYWNSNEVSGPFGLGAVTLRSSGGADSGVLDSFTTVTGARGSDRFGSSLKRVGRNVARDYSPFASGGGAPNSRRGLVSVLYADRPNLVVDGIPDYSIAGGKDNEGSTLSYAYDAKRDRLVVGKPAENKVTLRLGDSIFADPFDQISD